MKSDYSNHRFHAHCHYHPTYRADSDAAEDASVIGNVFLNGEKVLTSMV